jgi:hypothetical protein
MRELFMGQPGAEFIVFQSDEGLGVLGLVDDFVIRKQNDFYFGVRTIISSSVDPYL